MRTECAATIALMVKSPRAGGQSNKIVSYRLDYLSQASLRRCSRVPYSLNQPRPRQDAELEGTSERPLTAVCIVMDSILSPLINAL